MTKQAIWDRLNQMDREQMRTILEGIGTAVYDDEDIDDIKECIVENIESGDIPEYVLWEI